MSSSDKKWFGPSRPKCQGVRVCGCQDISAGSDTVFHLCTSQCDPFCSGACANRILTCQGFHKEARQVGGLSNLQPGACCFSVRPTAAQNTTSGNRVAHKIWAILLLAFTVDVTIMGPNRMANAFTVREAACEILDRLKLWCLICATLQKQDHMCEYCLGDFFQLGRGTFGRMCLCI